VCLAPGQDPRERPRTLPASFSCRIHHRQHAATAMWSIFALLPGIFCLRSWNESDWLVTLEAAPQAHLAFSRRHPPRPVVAHARSLRRPSRPPAMSVPSFPSGPSRATSRALPTPSRAHVARWRLRPIARTWERGGPLPAPHVINRRFLEPSNAVRAPPADSRLQAAQTYDRPSDSQSFFFWFLLISRGQRMYAWSAKRGLKRCGRWTRARLMVPCLVRMLPFLDLPVPGLPSPL